MHTAWRQRERRFVSLFGEVPLLVDRLQSREVERGRVEAALPDAWRRLLEGGA